jgi:GT2 family glycosyltransferase
MDLSIIILNYNTKDMLKKCLASAMASQTGFKLETIVADNGSVDGSLDMVRKEFLQVKIVDNQGNVGFSKGNNAAMRVAQGRYILLLNSDTMVGHDTFDLSIKYMDYHPGVGAMGCKVLLPNGELDQACRRRFPNPWNSFLRLFGFSRFSDYNFKNISVDQEMEVDAVMGAYMMVRKSVIGQVGMLDEDFFMYGEDLDWCWRIKEAGHKVMYYPVPRITHFKYGSSKSIPFKVITWAHDAMRIFYRKHYSSQYPQVLNWLVYTGIEVRKYLVMAVNLFRSKKTAH